MTCTSETTREPQVTHAVVDFLVPYVGRPDYLRAAVRSVLAQRNPAWRLVVVEDGPQGHDVAGWIADLGDDRVTHVLNPANLGVAGNFQRCLTLARAEWVVLLGCDDLLLPDYVDRLAATVRDHPGAAAVLPRVEVVDGEGRPVRGLTDRVKELLTPKVEVPTVWSGDRVLASLLHGNWSYFPSIAWRRERALDQGFRPDLPVTLDLALMADLLMSGAEIVTVPDLLFRYRRHQASASSVTARDVARFHEEARLFREVEQRCAALGWSRSERAARWHLTSKLHALTLAAGPGVTRSARRELLRHATGSRAHVRRLP
jgi:glycosyltransferase involved in cell wall biosynthesis